MSDNNNVFGKVIVDTGDIKRSKFSLNHQVSTSMDIGELQPLCCRLLKPKSKTICKGRHLVRLDPMVAPSVGSLKQKTWHHFVGMSELTRKFSALLTKQLVSGSTTFFRPQNLPYMTLSDISALCLIGADYTLYVHDPSASETADSADTYWRSFTNETSATATACVNFINGAYNPSFTATSFPSFSGGAVNLQLFFGNQFPANSWLPCGRTSSAQFFHRNGAFTDTSADSWSEVPLNSADYVVRQQYTNAGVTYQLCIAVRLSAFGKRIRKILIGCGYRINFLAASKNMSLMPLFAYYKAYFDSFGLCLFDSWESSRAKLLLERFDVGLLSNLSINQGIGDNELFLQFVCAELGRTYVSEDYDYISAHQSQDVYQNNSGAADGDKARGFVNNIVLNTPGSTNGVTGIGQTAQLVQGTAVQSATGHVYINRTNHTEVDAELLKILYKWTNRETAAGRRIAELLRAGGYGRYVDEQKSNFIGYEELDIDIVDVNATADSSNTIVGANSTLGEYVGKGVGVTKQGDIKSFEFENDEFGYWITLSAIVPESGFCQGVDPLNEVISADQFYSQEFDGLGMELEDFTIVKGDTDWQNRLEAAEVGRFTASFGMVPRHSRWKVSHNIVNGDIDLRSTRAGNLPFMLDKFISVGDRECKLVATTNTTSRYRAVKGLQMSDLPIGGYAWRFLNRFPWLNNFDRIFADLSTDVARFQQVIQGVITMGNYEYCAYGRDHFNVFNWFDMVTYSGMKPISESYGTTDENDGNGDTTMSRA